MASAKLPTITHSNNAVLTTTNSTGASRKRTRDSTHVIISSVEIAQTQLNGNSNENHIINLNGNNALPLTATTNGRSDLDVGASTSSYSRSHVIPEMQQEVSKVEHMTICKPAPYSTDPEAILDRDRCDYDVKICYEVARKGIAPRRVRVYADGIYDLFHQGHARQLMQAKNIFPNVYLIVGVCSDELTHEKKGRTVMNDKERYEAIRHCRYVDEVVPDAPWEITEEYLAHHKIDFVAHDELPYGGDDVEDIYAPLKSKGMFVATERTEGVSTSDIVARIVKDYDIYVRRNLARGYSAKDLNVSFLNEKKFRLQNKLDNLKDKGKNVMEKIGEKKDDFLTKWEEKSSNFIETFLLLFGKERLSNIWNESKGKLMQALSPPGSPNGSENGDNEEQEITPDELDSPPMKKRSSPINNNYNQYQLKSAKLNREYSYSNGKHNHNGNHESEEEDLH